jgi:hypothetical protein
MRKLSYYYDNGYQILEEDAISAVQQQEDIDNLILLGKAPVPHIVENPIFGMLKASIVDEWLPFLNDIPCVIAGGALTNLLSVHLFGTRIPYNDVDVFILGDNAADIALKFVHQNVPLETHISKSNVAYSFIYNPISGMSIRYNLIHGYKANTAQEVISTFDFRCASIAFDVQTQKLFHIGGALIDIANKKLFINPSARAPTVSRMLKYVKHKGFACSESQIKIFTELLLFHNVNNEKDYME